MSKKTRQALKSHFGFNSFRPFQEEIVDAVMSGSDVLAVMATGYGKSLIYQLSGAMMDGLSIVISPLISLMKDQADKLSALGFKVGVVNTNAGVREVRETFAKITNEELDFLYIAPERFGNDEFMDVIKGCRIGIVRVSGGMILDPPFGSCQ